MFTGVFTFVPTLFFSFYDIPNTVKQSPSRFMHKNPEARRVWATMLSRMATWWQSEELLSGVLNLGLFLSHPPGRVCVYWGPLPSNG